MLEDELQSPDELLIQCGGHVQGRLGGAVVKRKESYVDAADLLGRMASYVLQMIVKIIHS